MSSNFWKLILNLIFIFNDRLNKIWVGFSLDFASSQSTQFKEQQYRICFVFWPQWPVLFHQLNINSLSVGRHRRIIRVYGCMVRRNTWTVPESRRCGTSIPRPLSMRTFLLECCRTVYLKRKLHVQVFNTQSDSYSLSITSIMLVDNTYIFELLSAKEYMYLHVIGPGICKGGYSTVCLLSLKKYTVHVLSANEYTVCVRGPVICK